MRYLLLVLILLTTGCSLFQTTAAPTPQPTATTATTAATAVPPTATPPPLPTSAPPAPTRTPDPALPDWTILVYMNTDNNLDPAALLNLNQMEAAVGNDSTNLNLIIQLDRPATAAWSDTRRYQITADKDQQAFTSPTLQSMGELNMGDPATLADFIQWGRTTYPANHTLLILWDHGRGWQGISYDDTDSDSLTLPDLQQALATATADQPLDLIGFDACLMGQLELFAAVAPHAQLALASEELTPGAGWPYGTIIGRLSQQPRTAPAALATLIVDEFGQQYATSDPFTSMAAVDLAAIPAVVRHLEAVAAVLAADLPFHASALGAARSGVESYARAYGPAAEEYALVDLHHLASLLATLALDPTLAQTAADLQTAVETAVYHTYRGYGLPQANGLSLYFPRTAATYDENYRLITPLGTWGALVQDYHQLATAELTPPHVAITAGTAVTVSTQQPALVSFQLTGQAVEQVVLLAGQETALGRQLLTYDPLQPEPTYLPNGQRLSTWRDGLHEDFYVWDSRAAYLFSETSASGAFVVLWPGYGYTSTLRTIAGEFSTADGAPPVEANLTMDTSSRQQTAVWGFTADGSPYAITPRAGDGFRPYQLYFPADGRATGRTIQRQLGDLLLFDSLGTLRYDWRPLPSGTYFLGFQAQNQAGQTAVATTNFVVANDEASTTAVAYLDPYLGYQFTYPASWYRPTYDDTRLYTTNLTGTTHLQVTIYPNLASVGPAELKQQTLALFGGVDVLFEDKIVVGNYAGLRTVYGYTAADGPHTGLFATFVRGNTGFVVDLDAPATAETETLAIMADLLASWQFPAITAEGLFPGQWGTLQAGPFTLPRPADFTYEAVGGDWQRLTATADSRIFTALRTDLTATQPLTDAVRHWATVASQGVVGYQQGRFGRYALADQLWLRQDFSYRDNNNQEIWGFIIATERDGQHLVAWMEAPAAVAAEIETRIFTVLLAELTVR